MANRRASLYSPSRRALPPAAQPQEAAAGRAQPDAGAPAAAEAAPAAPLGTVPPGRGRRRWLQRALPVLAGGAFAAALVLAALLVAGRGPAGLPLTQALIDAAVRHSLENEPLPSQYAKAYEQVAPSVVRVVGLMDEDEDATDRPDRRAMDRSLGSGVVIKDDGTILTNLHVVHGAKKLRVTFANGQQSDAVLVGMQPENDLAVIKATQPPAELEPATMRSTGDLMPGDHVIAVGHPFGIGPSVSAGIVSGLQREFRAPDGERALTNLIQFDAAANPGNSGGPLVTADGYVVGIVTAILNPNEQSTFVGIGFAVPIENAAAAAGLSPF
jgi:S1-C subfamily serine protease